jgi:DNA ligase (NAD+)
LERIYKILPLKVPHARILREKKNRGKYGKVLVKDQGNSPDFFYSSFFRIFARYYAHAYMMDKIQAEKRIMELKAVLWENSRRYYVENAPVISDFEYDHLMKELEALEAEWPEFQTPDSPTQRVGSDITKGFAQFPHKYPMLSLGNTYNIAEIEEFADRASKALGGGFTYCCELKFDGTAICLTYRHGLLYRALTRGDGVVGDDVTVNARHIPSIPQKLSGEGWPEEFEIRGEILMPYEAFDRLNAEREDAGEMPFANPRNAASGSLKLQDPPYPRRRTRRRDPRRSPPEGRFLGASRFR